MGHFKDSRALSWLLYPSIDTIICVLLKMPAASTTAKMSFSVLSLNTCVIQAIFSGIDAYSPRFWSGLVQSNGSVRICQVTKGRFFYNFKIFLYISEYNCPWFYVIWNPEMSPDRTILHLVKNDYGMHTIKTHLRPWIYRARIKANLCPKQNQP